MSWLSNLGRLDAQARTEMAAGRVPTASVVVLATRPTLESRSLVNGDRARAILVLLVGILDSRNKRAEAVRLARLNGAVWPWSKQVVW